MQDKVLLFSEAQSVGAVSVVSDHYINSDVVVNLGNAPILETIVTDTLTPPGALTLTINLEIGTDATFGTKKVLTSSGAIAMTELVAGKQILMPIPHNFNSTYNHMRVVYVASATGATGKVTSNIVLHAFTNHDN